MKVDIGPYRFEVKLVKRITEQELEEIDAFLQANAVEPYIVVRQDPSILVDSVQEMHRHMERRDTS